MENELSVNTRIRNYIRLLTKSYYDYQLMRVRLSNRMQLKKDGSNMKNHPKNDETFLVEKKELDVQIFLDTMIKETKNKEELILEKITEYVKQTNLWKLFLVNVKGCGPLMAAVIISEFDIEKATTVSKMWAFAGISPGFTKGRKWNKDKTEIILSHNLVPQDKKTPGFLCPYNQWLRSKLIGVLATGMIKSQSEYAINYYYPMHTPKTRKAELGEGRYDIEENINTRTGKPWKDESDGHRNNAAKRKMIKMFIRDLYVNWRHIEGLPVRIPYEEEYLGIKHHIS
ncbi:MAG: hypothetical protein WC346_16475 [Methanogenium sp.]